MMTEQIISSKTSKIYAAVNDLIEVVSKAVDEQTPLHEVERNVLRRVLQIGGEAIGMLLNILGQGNVGEECKLADGRGRHVCGCATSLGNRSNRRYRRAVFASMPLFIADFSNVVPCESSFRSFRTCLSSIIANLLDFRRLRLCDTAFSPKTGREF